VTVDFGRVEATQTDGVPKNSLAFMLKYFGGNQLEEPAQNTTFGR
jgi:hypothetical protein